MLKAKKEEYDLARRDNNKTWMEKLEDEITVLKTAPGTQPSLITQLVKTFFVIDLSFSFLLCF